MTHLNDLLKQQEELQKKINDEKIKEKAKALKEVRRLCKLYGFTYNQLKGHLSPGRQRKS